MKPQVQEIADEISYTWADASVRVTFSRLRETDTGAVRGTIKVGSTRPELLGNGGGRIWWSIVTLTTASDRKTLTAKLDRAAPVGGGWESDVDRCFEDCYERHTRVPEPVDLADVYLPTLDTSFLYEPVLPAGQIALFLADQGSTKSYLMLYLSTCTVTGHESVFGPPARTGPVIYFDWEVDENVARRRLAWISRGLGLDTVPRGLRYVNMSERGRLLDRARDMRQQIDRIKPVMIVIDSLTFATGGDLNSAEYAAPTMSAIGSLGDGVTKLVSAHPSKSSRNADAQDISVIGSGLFEFRARAIWLMRREKERSSRFGVSMTARKPFDGAPTEPLAYRMHFDNEAKAARFQPSRVQDSAELSAQALSLVERIRMALGKHGPMDTNQLAELLDGTAPVVKSACNKMPDVFAMTVGGGRGKPTVWSLGQANGEVPWWTGDKQ